MSFGKKESAPEPEPDLAGIEDETISNSQESVPVPVICGTRKVTIRWISPIYNQRAVQREEKVK